MTTRILLTLVCGTALLSSAFAQDEVQWDNSGNSLLQGAYNFRQVVWQVGDENGGLKRQVALTGRLEFDGQGNYNLTAQVADSQAGTDLRSFSKQGTYSIAASGHGFLSSTVFDDGKVFGLVSQGIFLGSSTESGVNDILIAAPAASPASTNSSFNGRYWATEMNFPSLDPAQGRDALWQMDPDGNGSVGALTVGGFIGGRARRVTQNIASAPYSFSNGTGTLRLGGTLGANTLLAGDRVFFLSPDGNFFFGGSLNGWNMLVGMKALPEKPAAETFRGLYYQVGADAFVFPDGAAEFHSYFGSLTVGEEDQINQARFYVGFDEYAYNFSYSDFVELDDSGRYEDYLGFQNIVGAGGLVRIAFGLPYESDGNNIGLSIALKAPSLKGDGVFLDPTGVVNAASEMPFTEGIARGEIIRLKGTGLAAATTEDATFPTKLGDVQVLINGRPSPIKKVSPTEIVAIVPYATKEGIAAIQIVSGDAQSNVITVYVNATSPAFYTADPGGLGYVKGMHADGSPISEDSPARTGEKISLLLNGLGDVTPEVLEGTPGPEKERSKVVADTVISIRLDEADATFIGLAPNLIGIYQADISVGASAREGDAYLNIGTVDAYNSQVYMPIVRATASEAREAITQQPVQRKGNTLRRPSGWHPSGLRRR
ncbi:MAG: hypothetical protein HY820_10920 [Acidobacteria bacterium]|nr:hypothetical protein [Acidobacteriota bacterium]